MVTELIKSENSYQVAFRNMRATKPAPAWVELVRETAMERFAQLGFPQVTDEEWKYTNLAALSKSAFEPAIAVSKPSADVTQFAFAETASSHLVVINGLLREDLSNLDGIGQVVAIDLFTAIEDARYHKIVREYLARNATYHDSAMVALNTAFLQSGVVLLLPRNVTLEKPLQITYVSDSGESGNAGFPRVLVVAEENSSATLVEHFVSTNGAAGFTNAVAEVVLMEGARLEHYRVQRDNKQSLDVATTSAELGRGSSYDATSITLGAQLSRHDIQVVMDHEGAECWVDGLYVVGDNQHADTHSVIDHKQAHCNSHQLYKGILDGNGDR